MLPVFQKIDADINHSFYVGHRKSSYFPNPYMFHPDVELLLVIKGTGTRLIGDSIKRFSPGDLIMIGPNVPHAWYSDEVYKKEESNLQSEAIFILFNPRFISRRINFSLSNHNRHSSILAKLGVKSTKGI